MARLEDLDEISAGAMAAAEADAKKAQDEAAAKVEKNNERANEVRGGTADRFLYAYYVLWCFVH